MTVAVHEVVSPVGLLEAKNAPGTSESQIFHGRMEGKNLNRTGEEAIGAPREEDLREEGEEVVLTSTAVTAADYHLSFEG